MIKMTPERKYWLAVLMVLLVLIGPLLITTIIGTRCYVNGEVICLKY